MTSVSGTMRCRYDDNGNMTSRAVDSVTYSLTYDAENRLQRVTNTDTGEVTTFTYDADGQRVKRDTVTNTIVYVGSHYEARFEAQDMPEDFDGDCRITIVDIMLVAVRWSCECGDECYDSLYDFDDDCDIDVADIMQVAARWRETCPEELAETVKYYTLGGKRVAMLKEPVGQADTLYYLFSDHLGSTSVSYRATDGITITQRYYPWGTIRPGPDNALPTDYTFTGQKLDESTGLMYYGARYYDPALGRFVQADTVVPNPANPQDLNRYAYAANSPLSFVDPNGHQVRPPESCDSICYTGTLGPYNVEAASPAVQPLTTASYQTSHDVYYITAMPPRQALGSEAFIQAHRPGAGVLISPLWSS